MSISSMFEIGRRSLSTYKSAIDVTSGNIANANNPGYTRRRVDLRNLTQTNGVLGRLGSGVSPGDLLRTRQRFAETALWRENAGLAKYEQSETMLQQVESIFGDASSGGLSNVLSEFWNSWNDLANDPESDSLRSLVKNKGQLLADSMNNTYNRTLQFQQQIKPQISGTVNDINRIGRQLVNLNRELRVSDNPDLLDSRDQLISDLSKMINISVKEKDTGEVSIFSGGYLLVSDTKQNELSVSFNSDSAVQSAAVVFKDSNFEPEIEGGTLAGMMDTFNNKIPSYLDSLDTLAVNVAEKVNELHAAGYNVAGTTGVNFFDDGVSGASSFRMNAAIVEDPTLIATRAATEGVGSNSVAESIFNLQFDTIVENQAPSDFFTNLLSVIGSDIDNASFLRESQELITQNLQNQKDQVAGVSLDEEMTKLVQYEQAYQAAAKIINTVDQMLETVLSLR